MSAHPAMSLADELKMLASGPDSSPQLNRLANTAADLGV
jgi:hypothetical protein